uniref:BPTI/Kunitz inhibitor domain-containing protein n=1 Tax=Panagrolaimus sp. ES5 TaxID=591445 RepID=A0AC34FVR3_9BILA
MLKLGIIIIYWSYIVTFVEANLGGVLCRLPKDSGYQCGMSIPHSAYHFDVSIGECIEFIFNGCGGNQNRFGTKDECLLGCGALGIF